MITNSNKTYIHYGSEHFEPERFKVVTNKDFWNKPGGGLWASAIDADYGWKEWCENEEFHVDRLETYFKFRLKPEAKVLMLRKPTDAKDMPSLKNVPVIALSCNNSDIYLDFVRLRDEFGVDAVEIEDINAMYWSMYGWDCDSIVVLNPDVIEEVDEMNDNVTLIGWCEQNNVKGLLCSDDSVIYPGDGKESYEKGIKFLIEYCEKKGLEFPEFAWDGYKWVRK